MAIFGIAGKRKKTSLMLACEERIGKPLEDFLVERLNGSHVNDGAFEQIAEDLMVSKSSLTTWLYALGITLATVAVVPGDRVYAVSHEGYKRLLLEV